MNDNSTIWIIAAMGVLGAWLKYKAPRWFLVVFFVLALAFVVVFLIRDFA